MLAALSEACSPATAEDCAKLPKPKLAETCAERIPGRGWLPPALITPEQPEAEAEDQAPEDQAPEDQAPEDQADDAAGDADMADTENGDDAETLADEIGRAQVCTPVTNAHIVCHILLIKKNKHTSHSIRSDI